MKWIRSPIYLAPTERDDDVVNMPRKRGSGSPRRGLRDGFPHPWTSRVGKTWKISVLGNVEEGFQSHEIKAELHFELRCFVPYLLREVARRTDCSDGQEKTVRTAAPPANTKSPGSSPVNKRQVGLSKGSMPLMKRACKG